MKTHDDGRPLTVEERIADLESIADEMRPFVAVYRFIKGSFSWVKTQLPLVIPIAGLGMAVLTYLKSK